MENNPLSGAGGVIAWITILLALFVVLAGPGLRGCASGIEAFGDAMRAMAGESE